MAAQKPRKSTGEYIDKLNTLDFALGIRSQEINENFNLLKYWIDAERLRIGGWGIVEGFELTKNVPQRRISVSDGILINRQGEEIEVPGQTFGPIPIEHAKQGETVKSDANGKIVLTYPVYSHSGEHIVFYSPGMSGSDNEAIERMGRYNELEIRISDTGEKISLSQNIVSISEKTIQLTPRWSNTEFYISYDHAYDRVDGIYVKYDGSEYKMDPFDTSIISTSPSRRDPDEYLNNDWYLIGLAYWHVGQEIDVTFFTGERMLRPIFVDNHNILYLNGKQYQEKTVIYFKEPKPPSENDLWYDVTREILFIWRKGEDGEYDWQPVNDLARGITCTHLFQTYENPDDLQTFDYSKTHPELFFMPGKHQLTIIIDQVVIMEDQYEELYYGKEEIETMQQNGEAWEEQLLQISKNLCGYGFRLKRPLERPSIIEVRVNHDLNTRKHDDDLYQHQFIFVQAGQYTVSDPEENIFHAKCEYNPDSNQLEVYKNGLRLLAGTQFTEIYSETGNTEMCDRFQVNSLAAGDIIDYRVMRSVSSYANLKQIISEYEKTVTDLRQHVNEAVASINERQEIIAENIGGLQTTLSEHATDIEDLKDNALRKQDTIAVDKLPEIISKNAVTGKFSTDIAINGAEIFLSGISQNDFMTVAYAADDDANLILLSEAKGDYTLTQEEDGLYLYLSGKWTDVPSAKLYITGLKLGA